MTESAVDASRVAKHISPTKESFGTRHRRGFMIAALVGFLLTMVGALETSQIAFLPRLVYWEILMISGAVIGIGVSEMVENWGRLRSRPWAEMPFLATLIALPLTLMVVGTSSLFFETRQPDFRAFSAMFAITFLISLVMTALNYFIHRPDSIRLSTNPDPLPLQTTESVKPHLSARLPMNLRHLDIIALEAEDHYLRIHFHDANSTLILMRLSDAIGEIPSENGAQTHRSWWVAKDAIQSIAKDDGRATLTLACGLQVPVSRNYYRKLSEAGLFA